MKIVYFNYLWDLWGLSIGSTIKAIELMNALATNGHEVKIYWRSDDITNRSSRMSSNASGARDFLKKYLKKYLHEPNQIFKNFKLIKEEARILNQEKPDLVISRVSNYITSPKTLTKKTGIPFLIEADSPSSYEKMNYQKYFRSTKSILYRMEEDFINAGKASFTVSNMLKSYFVERGIPGDTMAVIPNGADPVRFSPDTPGKAIKERYQLQDSLVVGFVGSFIYWHGIENLVKIIERTLSANKHVKFLMVGEGGPMKPLIEKFITENRLEQRTILTGFVEHDDIPQYIAAMDIVLAPYPNLKFFYYSPVKIFEYMSCGRAVVSTEIGQINEIIENGRNGLLAEPENIDQMCDLVFQLLKSDALRKKVGDEARKDILEKHTWDLRGKQLSDLCITCVS